MAQLYVPAIRRNARAYVLARHGPLPHDQGHTSESPRARIDTGALHVVLPPQVAVQLGLLRMGWTAATMADGRLVEGEVTEPVDVDIMPRQTRTQAIVLGDTVLIGAWVLEGLDRAVNCLRGQLLPNLGTIAQPVCRV
jgi:predicted aspartyl protease